MIAIFLYSLVLLAVSSAAPIVWGTASNVSTSSEVSTNGTLIEAFNLGDPSVTNETVNGVLFTAKLDLLSGSAGNDVYTGSTGDTAYDTILSAIDFGGGTNTVTLSIGNGSLTTGVNYEIQAWYVDNRYLTTPRITPVGDGNGNTVLLSSIGQYAIGNFTADGSSQTLTLESPDFGNAHLNAYQIRALSSFPIATLTSPSSSVSGNFTLTITFSEPVTGFTESDLTVTNGSLVTGTLTGSGASYTIEVAPTLSDTTTITLPANTVLDENNEANAVPASLSVTPSTPTHGVTLLAHHDCVYAPYEVTAHFHPESTGVARLMTGLTIGDFIVSNGTLSNFIDHADGNYKVTVSPTTFGTVTISLPAGVANSTTDGLSNLASNTITTDYTLSPKVEISGGNLTGDDEFNVFISFTPYISGFDASDIVVSNGSVTSLVMQGRREFLDRFYRATIKADMPGAVTVSIPAGVATNSGNPSYFNTASNVFSATVTDGFGDHWTVDTDTEWSSAEGSSSNVTLGNGLVTPNAASSTFSSIIKTFPSKKQATDVIFTQSNAWTNWTAAGNISPSGAGNAPIFLPIANDDYYFFGQSTNSAYHAWHSTDMVNWTKLDQFSHDSYQWCTSAEYRDGTFYLLNDTPNDHTPHLFTDTDLNDGQVGTFHGMVFNDPTSGGDSVLFRDNTDGLFHIISEDYSPIRAASHSWDSPLATHASSVDCINGFVPAEHLPPVDVRTTPTGTYATYTHPHLAGTHRSNPLTYEVHSGEQKALGDWAAIKVGERYYLFGDYEHDTGTKFINTGWFCSDSIYDQFELVGNIGDGHPDPDVGFAEGQFYLITQQNTDYISPGPWVDGVEARAGVDADNNGTIDQWTGWQAIKEAYDHTPGYAKVVTTTPAALDLSTLPAGYGFQFEFRVDDSVVTGVTPMMDKVEMCFQPSNFQSWANTAGIPADADSDGNDNGVPDIVDFSIEQPFCPQIEPNGTLSLTVRDEAISDGVSVDLVFNADLSTTWTVADTSTQGVKLLNTNVTASGDHQLTFQVNEATSDKLFMRMKIDMP